jgi:hypothetical protein
LCFAKDGRAGCFDEFQAHDDPAALREAELHLDGNQGDLWCGDRHVATLSAEVRHLSYGAIAGTAAPTQGAAPLALAS